MPHKCPAHLVNPLAKASLRYADTKVLDGLSKEFGLKRSTVRGYLKDIEDRGVEVRRPYSTSPNRKPIDDEIEISPPVTRQEKSDYFDRAWEEYRSIIGMSDKHKPPKKLKSKSGHTRRLAIISDTHGKPHMDGIVKMLSHKPDLVLVVGDVHDLMAVSRFPKEIEVPIEEDVANVRAMVETIASQCAIELCEGNHDIRVARYFQARIDARYMKLVNCNMLDWAVTGVPNAHIVKNLHGFKTSQGTMFPDILKTSFLIFEGDAVFAHAEVARKGELNTVRGVYEWYENWRRPMGFPEAKFLGQAHVHRAGSAYPAGGHRLLAELGAMLSPAVLQYTMAGNASYTPPAIGYTILEQHKEKDRWVTDLNSYHFVLC